MSQHERVFESGRHQPLSESVILQHGPTHKKWAEFFPRCFCRLRECVCDGGTPDKGIPCAKPGAVSCASCESKFDTVNVTAGGCVERPCRCEGGTMLIGERGQCVLLKDGAAKGKAYVNCQSGTCEAGTHRSSETRECEESTCRCIFGKKAVGKGPTLNETCPSPGATQCLECKAGYHKEAIGKSNNITMHNCLVNLCNAVDRVDPTIEHFPLEGAPCPIHKVTKGYDSCVDNRYQLQSTKVNCIYKKCKCKNGVAAEGADCHSHGVQWCMNCTEFFHMVRVGGDLTGMQSCMQNVCRPDPKTAGSVAALEGLLRRANSTQRVFFTITHLEKHSRNLEKTIMLGGDIRGLMNIMSLS